MPFHIYIGTVSVVCGAGSMQLSCVCLFVPSGSKPTWRLVDIDWLLHGWHTAGMQTVPRRRLNADLFIDLLLSQVTYSLGCIAMQSIRCCLLLQIFCWSVCVSASHSLALCQHGWTDWDAFWAIDAGGSREPCIIWGPELPQEVLLLVGLAWACPLLPAVNILNFIQ